MNLVPCRRDMRTCPHEADIQPRRLTTADHFNKRSTSPTTRFRLCLQRLQQPCSLLLTPDNLPTALLSHSTFARCLLLLIRRSCHPRRVFDNAKATPHCRLNSLSALSSWAPIDRPIVSALSPPKPMPKSWKSCAYDWPRLASNAPNVVYISLPNGRCLAVSKLSINVNH